MKALVIGGGGFIGRHLVARLLAGGAEVRVLDRDLSAVPRAADAIAGSVTDPAAVSRAMAGIEQVYNLAAETALWLRDRSRFEIVNHGGTRTVLAAAAARRVRRLVHTSSEIVFVGRSSPTRPHRVDESLALPCEEMLGAYARSKWRAEAAALAAARAGLPVVVVNPTLPIGPGDGHRTPPTQMLLDLLGGRVPVWLDCVLNLVDVRDLAHGHVLAAERGCAGERYLLAGESLRFGALVRAVEAISGIPLPQRRIPGFLALLAACADEALGRLVPGHRPRAPIAGVRVAMRPAVFSARKARRELGFAPRPARDALSDAVGWLMTEHRLNRVVPESDRERRAEGSA